MENNIQIIAKHIENGKVIEETILIDRAVDKVTSIDQLGFNHKQQVELLKKGQDALLKAQATMLYTDLEVCPKCKTKLKFAGQVFSEFHSVFSDHKVAVRRRKCCNKDCGWTSVPSVSSLFNTNVHPDLSKLQTEMACNHTYREAEQIINAMSYYERKVNNHKHIHRTVEVVGNYISDNQITHVPTDAPFAQELICQVDFGHLKSKEKDSRSFEALTSVIYDPAKVKYPTKSEDKILEKNEVPRGKILSKHCAASALDDNLVSIKRQTVVAAQKQGMTVETKITALCDGASNCWNVIDNLEEQCSTVTRILDWFHIAKRFTNISLPKYLSKKLDKLKWCIWHGKVEEGLNRFDEIIEKTRSEKMRDRITKLKNYLENNKSYLVEYSDRHKLGKVISSSLAESNVESLINKRCKGKQHMQWSREGVHPLLQVRASCASNDWIQFGSSYVLNATTQAA